MIYAVCNIISACYIDTPCSVIVVLSSFSFFSPIMICGFVRKKTINFNISLLCGWHFITRMFFCFVFQIPKFFPFSPYLSYCWPIVFPFRSIDGLICIERFPNRKKMNDFLSFLSILWWEWKPASQPVSHTDWHESIFFDFLLSFLEYLILRFLSFCCIQV